jgi:hypothetical protein
MAGMLNDVLAPERLSLHGYFKRERITSLIADFMKGNDALTFKIWTLLVFQLWYEDHLLENQSKPDAYAIAGAGRPLAYKNPV